MEPSDIDTPPLQTTTTTPEKSFSPGLPEEQPFIVKKLGPSLDIDPNDDPSLDPDTNEYLDFDSHFDQSNTIERCTICLEFLDKKLSALECGHVYHSECIHSYFQSL
jgi:hypothetical protein